MSESSARLFVAVELGRQAREAVRAGLAGVSGEGVDARWTGSEQWHVTLAFLGSVSPALASAVRGVLAEVAAGSAPMTVALTGDAGTFNRRVLWAGIDGGRQLTGLAERTRDALGDLGLAVDDRPFRAHLTLARARGKGRLPAGLASAYATEPVAWTVDRLVLMRSTLSSTGARYTVESAWRLGQG